MESPVLDSERHHRCTRRRLGLTERASASAQTELVATHQHSTPDLRDCRHLACCLAAIRQDQDCSSAGPIIHSQLTLETWKLSSGLKACHPEHPEELDFDKSQDGSSAVWLGVANTRKVRAGLAFLNSVPYWLPRLPSGRLTLALRFAIAIAIAIEGI